MGVLKIPIQAIALSGIAPELYMAERLKAVGAPIYVVKGQVKRLGKIIQQDDKDKKNIIFSWEDVK